MKHKPTYLMALAFSLIVAIITSSCGPTIIAPTGTLPPPTATAVLEIATAAPIPSAAATQAAPTSASSPVPTETSATATEAGTAIFSTDGDSASFVTDVTIPDGMAVAPGATFTKTWRLSNNGSTTWSTAYTLVYSSGNLSGDVQSVPLPVEVPSGKSVDLSVPFTAPATSGQYTSLWMLKNDAGQLFGVGPNSNEPFYVLINVSPSVTVDPNATTAPGGSGSVLVTGTSLSADQTTYSGSCPVTINLTGAIIVEGSGSFAYQLEAEATTSGFTFNLPAAQSSSYSTAGSHTLNLSYSLTISSSVQGWVKLYVSSPNTLRSNQVDLAITCQ